MTKFYSKKYVPSTRFISAFFACFLFALVFGGKIANAAETVDQSSLYDTGIFSPVYNFAVNFTPTTYNITAFEFAVTNNLNNLNVGLTICSGVATSGLPSLSCGTNVFVASTSAVQNGSGVHKISFTSPIPLIAGSHYYAIVSGTSGAGFSMKQNSGGTVKDFYTVGYGGNLTNQYSNGFYFKTYYDTAFFSNVVRPVATNLIFKPNAKNEVQFYYDFCGNYSNVNDVTAALDVYNGNYFSLPHNVLSIIKDKTNFTGPQMCSGLFSLYYDTTGDSSSIGQLAAEILLNDYGVGTTSIIYSLPVSYSIGSGSNYIRSGDISPIVFPVSSTSTYQLHVIYDLTGLDWATTSICYYNDFGNNSSLCFTPTSPRGFGVINWPNNGVTNIGTLNFRGFFSSPDYLTLKSGFIDIQFVGDQLITNAAGIFGSSTADMVCSAAEWNSTSTYLGMNFTYLKCSVMKSLLDIGEKVGNAPAAAANGFIYVLKNTFPLNLFAQFKQSWDDSETAALPVTLSFMNVIDANGNIHITPPPLGGAATTTLLVWGPDVISGNSIAQNFIDFIRALSTFFFWYLFISQIYYLATEVTDNVDNK